MIFIVEKPTPATGEAESIALDCTELESDDSSLHDISVTVYYKDSNIPSY
jgi:hypothetical protein